MTAEVTRQGQAVSEIASAVTGKSAVEAGSSLLGGSILGGLAKTAESGFSWQSLWKEVLPFGGLISGIAGLFSSPARPEPLARYNAPLPLNFSGVLGRDGRISQESGDSSGHARGSSGLVDLTDAARGATLAMGTSPADPVSHYSGLLDLRATVQNLVTADTPPQESAISRREEPEPSIHESQTRWDSGGEVRKNGDAMPVFDSSWFMDHAPYIAAAVRNAMLDSHPIVDVVNDL